MMSYKLQLLVLLLFPAITLAQTGKPEQVKPKPGSTKEQVNYTTESSQLTLETAFKLTARARAAARSLNKDVSVAIVDATGQVIMISRGNGVGPHNTEAARRKAYTSLSTKTPTLLLARNARSNPDTQNLAHLPELLLLGGGLPIWHKGQVIGGIGVAGGGGPENDDRIAKAAAMEEAAILIQ